MLNLPTTNSQILVITGAVASSIAVHASFIDIGPSNAVIPGALDTTITTPTTTVVVPPPLPTFSRNVKFLSVTNTSGVPCSVTIQQTDADLVILYYASAWIYDSVQHGRKWISYLQQRRENLS
jgi:hypothetical protein